MDLSRFYRTPANGSLALAIARAGDHYKKYVLWNAGICPIILKVGHVTLATPHLGSFIVPCVLAIAYIQQRKHEVSSFSNLIVMEGGVPKF